MKGMFSAVLLMTLGVVGTCQDASDSSSDHRARVRECADCVGSRSCAATYDDCIDDCAGVQGVQAP